MELGAFEKTPTSDFPVLPISATYIELRISFEKETLTKKTYYEKENRSEF